MSDRAKPQRSALIVIGGVVLLAVLLCTVGTTLTLSLKWRSVAKDVGGLTAGPAKDFTLETRNQLAEDWSKNEVVAAEKHLGARWKVHVKVIGIRSPNRIICFLESVDPSDTRIELNHDEVRKVESLKCYYVEATLKEAKPNKFLRYDLVFTDGVVIGEAPPVPESPRSSSSGRPLVGK